MFKKLSYTALVAVIAVVFAIGAATTSDAKGKKKKAAAPLPAMCDMTDKPVCATKGQKYTYANACFAMKDGAKIVSSKACPTKKAKKAKKAKKKSKKKMAKKKAMKKS